MRTGPVVIGQGVLVLNEEGRFRLNVMKTCSVMRLVKSQNRLLRVFKARLAKALTNLII